MLVPVAMASHLIFGVVEVDKLQPLQADNLIYLPDGFLIAFGVSQIITRAVTMTGIHAYPDPVFLLNTVNNLALMFKLIAQPGARAGSIFQKYMYR